MKKRVTALFLTFLMLFLAACGSTEQAVTTSTLWEAIPEETKETAAEEAAVEEETAVPSKEESTDAGTDAAASETFETTAEDTTETTGTLDALMADFMTQHGLNESNFSVSCKNLVTGETYYYNELTMFDGASTYKLPLNLLYYDLEAAGTYTEDSIIPGTDTPLSECHYQSLVYSNNELSEAMTNAYGSYDVLKSDMRRYYTLTDEEIDDSYYHHNYFCSRMMMDCAAYLYANQDRYPDALSFLEQAQPGMYFRTYLPDVTIAQKYGRRDGYEHTAGIVFADTPFVLSVYSYQAANAADMIGQCAKLFYDYTMGE